jgi:hypothetical protein
MQRAPKRRRESMGGLQSLLYTSRYVDQSCHERQLRRVYTRGTCFSGFREQGGSCFVNYYSQSQTAIRTLAASKGRRRKSLVVSLETDSLVVESEKKELIGEPWYVTNAVAGFEVLAKSIELWSSVFLSWSSGPPVYWRFYVDRWPQLRQGRSKNYLVGSDLCVRHSTWHSSRSLYTHTPPLSTHSHTHFRTTTTRTKARQNRRRARSSPKLRRKMRTRSRPKLRKPLPRKPPAKRPRARRLPANLRPLPKSRTSYW